jgi:hypothetical protein
MHLQRELLRGGSSLFNVLFSTSMQFTLYIQVHYVHEWVLLQINFSSSNGEIWNAHALRILRTTKM